MSFMYLFYMFSFYYISICFTNPLIYSIITSTLVITYVFCQVTGSMWKCYLSHRPTASAQDCACVFAVRNNTYGTRGRFRQRAGHLAPTGCLRRRIWRITQRTKLRSISHDTAEFNMETDFREIEWLDIESVNMYDECVKSEFDLYSVRVQLRYNWLLQSL